MITLKDNLELCLTFALQDHTNIDKRECHYVAKQIAPYMDKEVRRLFKFFIKGHFRHEQNHEIRIAIREFIRISIDEEGREI